jgi:hypothetical protein
MLAKAQIYAEDVKPIFRELRALSGTWFMPTDRGDRLEIWSIANDSTLVGKTVRIKPETGDTVTLELLRLEKRDTVITFITIARGQNKTEPVPFVLTSAEYEGYIFENPNHDDPQKIKYRLLGNRELQVNTEGKKGNRPVTNEYVYEREFSPSTMQFRLRGGMNYHNLRGTGYFPKDDLGNAPQFGWKPGWEVGAGVTFKGRGGFISVNIEMNLIGRYASAVSGFTAIKDTTVTTYVRNLTYKTTWINIAFIPEITLRRDGRFSIIAGPYVGRLLSSRGKGELKPIENKKYNSNNDFKKTEIGLIGGIQYKLKTGKKDLDSVIGIRANLGLSDIDNLYTRYSDNAALSNGRISFIGASLYYSVNLLKL